MLLSTGQFFGQVIEPPSFSSPLDLSPLIWYDPSDLATLWQDTARTTPVTTDADVIGAMDDKSGNGNHVTQGTTANKPLYKTAGGLHWALGDGVNDVMTGTLTAFTDSDPFHMLVAGKAVTSPENNDGFMVLARNGASGRTQRSLAFDSSGATFKGDARGFSSNMAATLTTLSVFEGRFSDTSVVAVIDVAVDGGTFNTNTHSSGSMLQALNSAFGVFEGLTKSPSNVEIYSLLVFNRHLTAPERSYLVTHMGSKMGLTL